MKASEFRTLIDEHIAKFGDSPIIIEYVEKDKYDGCTGMTYRMIRVESRDVRVVNFAGQLYLTLCE